ncbi:hypothetical protein KP509_13G097000 [Ceratopteris richardii]|uniref:Uncharacterized protein n=1 Tax=Ceratopteris richardii TaxID=49495 RepID=A0A8T2TLF6_CERRI|nr:hypothetical protein KP509_13G097000 [Ceratopteris richardii]
MSYRERCMSGVFSKILGHLGLGKHSHASAKGKSPEAAPPPSTQSFPTVSGDSFPTQVHACRAPLPSSQQTHERGHMGTFNVVINQDGVPKEKKVAEKTTAAGFRVRVSVPVYHEPLTPVVIECTSGSGGVQGLQWYSEKLMVDEDGDVAQEFLDEVIAQSSGSHVGYAKMHTSFKLKMKTQPAKLTGPVHTFDGNVVQTLQPSTFSRQNSLSVLYEA